MTDTDDKGKKKNEADEPTDDVQKEDSLDTEEPSESSEDKKCCDEKPSASSKDKKCCDEKPSESSKDKKSTTGKELPEGRVKPPDDMDATAILPTKRTSYGESFFKTLTYLSKISKDKTLTFRDSDKTTSNLLGMALLGSVVFMALPSMNLPSLAVICYVIADILLVLAIGGFVLTRFGIIRAMEPRYALVCWHLMVGASVLATTLVFNLVAIIVIFLNYEKIRMFLGS